MRAAPTLTQAKFRGCVSGQCVGDALGMPVEQLSPQACQTYVKGLQSGQIGEIHHPKFTVVQYTDDSQLMRELIRSFVACEEFDPSDYARRIVWIITTRSIVGASRVTTKVAQRLIEGVAWDEAGTPAPYARNGSAMRSAPIGPFFGDSLERLIQAACQQGQITHPDSRASAGAIAIAGATALAVQANTEASQAVGNLKLNC